MPVPPDYTAWRFWMDILQSFGIVGVGVYNYLSNRRRINDKRFKALEEKVSSLTPPEECKSHNRETQAAHLAIERLQKDVDHLPNRREVKELTDNMTQLSGKIEHFAGRFEGINRAVDLINEHLLNGRNKG